MKYQDIICGFDFIMSGKDIASDIAIVNKFEPNQVGMESTVSELEGTGVKAREWFLKGLDAIKGRALLKGEAYLEFWIKAIKHNEVTANGRQYPYEPWKASMESRSVQNQFNVGGIVGEAEHPMLKMCSENPESAMSQYNNVMRVNRTERTNNCTHWVVGYKCTPEVSYLKIRTNPENPVIVNDLLAKKIPAFSIRTTGDFDMQNGVQVARTLKFITCDYVGNPANAEALAIPDVKYIDPLNMKELDMMITSDKGSMMAAESEDNPFFGIMKPGDKLLYSDKVDARTALSHMIIRRPVREEKSFDDEFKMLKKSFL